MINFLFNKIFNDQDFAKLTGGGTRQRGGDWTTSNTVLCEYFY